MASYTVELRKLIELYGREEIENWFKNYQLEHYLTPTQIEQIEKFHVWSKDRLASKIVDHYYMREIGFETPELFKHYAKVTMQEIMERYLPKIYSNFLEYDPLSNVDFTETYTREINNENSNAGSSTSTGSQTNEGSSTSTGSQTNEGSSTSTGSQTNEGSSTSSSSQSGNGFNIINDTPQTKITKQTLESGIYATQTNQSETSTEIEDETNTENSSSSSSSTTTEDSISTSSSTSTEDSISTSNSTSTEDSISTSSSTSTENSGNSSTVETFTRHEEGDNGVIITNQRLVKEYREIIVAIDEEIIYELGKLFMAIY